MLIRLVEYENISHRTISDLAYTIYITTKLFEGIIIYLRKEVYYFDGERPTGKYFDSK
jgi:hypothetical protein